MSSDFLQETKNIMRSRGGYLRWASGTVRQMRASCYLNHAPFHAECQEVSLSFLPSAWHSNRRCALSCASDIRARQCGQGTERGLRFITWDQCCNNCDLAACYCAAFAERELEQGSQTESSPAQDTQAGYLHTIPLHRRDNIAQCSGQLAQS